jgi:uroporphyrinogen-III synthase
MKSELARLIDKHGGEPLSVPALRESPELTREAADKLLQQLEDGEHDVVIFMTGVAVSLLFEAAEQAGARTQLVAALRQLTTVCRGPKPTAALKGFGVPPTLTAREPFTAAEVLDAIAGIELCERKVLLFHYGERSETLAETLLAWHAQLTEFWLYRWLMPTDTTDLENLVQRILKREVRALAITCQIQFRHLMQVARSMRVDRQLVSALNDHIVVAVVGPKCAAILQAHGVSVRVTPDHPKMGPLAVTLMRHLERPAPVDGISQLTVAPR